MKIDTRVLGAIRKAKTIVISGHRNPDGDSIGSLLALGLGLEKAGKRVYMISGDEVPGIYAFLPGYGRIQKTIEGSVDLAIAVDCGMKDLLGENAGVFKKAKSVLEIDHHEFREPFGDMRLIDHEAAAVGELVYGLFKKLRIAIDKDIAINILTSVIIETNSFRLPKVRTQTFRICAGLLSTGIDFYKLVEALFWLKTKESVILSGICLSRCRFLKNGQIAWSIVKRSDFQKVKGKEYDVDAVAEEMRCIRGVEVIVLFRETNKNMLRVSLRSKGKHNVASIAEKYKGGGHFDTAGCFIPNTSSSVKRFLALAENLLSD